MHEPLSFDPPPELKGRVARALAETTAERIPVRTRVAIAVAALPLLAVGVLLMRQAFLGTSALRIDLGTLTWLPFTARLTGLFIWTAAVTAIAVRAGRGGLGSRARALTFAALGAAPMYAIATLIAPAKSDDPAACDAVSQLSPMGYPCAIVALLVGGLALAALVRALRGAGPAAPRLRGAALGAAAGLWAGLALVVHCPANDLAHLLVGHALPVAAFAVIGALIATRVLKP